MVEEGVRDHPPLRTGARKRAFKSEKQGLQLGVREST
jgi:hypothetical protein